MKKESIIIVILFILIIILAWFAWSDDWFGIRPKSEAALEVTTVQDTAPVGKVPLPDKADIPLEEQQACTNYEDECPACIGCADDKQFCSPVWKKCIDCAITENCKTGYKCSDEYNCLPGECEDDDECYDDKVATKDVCLSVNCVHTPITQCVNNDFYCPTTCTVANDNDCGDKCGKQIIDCGEGAPLNECYRTAISNCCPAKIIYHSDFPNWFFQFYVKAYREIKGRENQKCLEYVSIQDARVYVTDEVRAQAITEEELTDLLARSYGPGEVMTEGMMDSSSAEMDKNIKRIINKDSTCRYPLDYIVNKYPSDVDRSQCTGSIYNIAYEGETGNDEAQTVITTFIRDFIN